MRKAVGLELIVGKNVKLPEAFVAEVKKAAIKEHRSVPKQIEFYYRVARAAIQNPELPFNFVLGTMQAIEEEGESKEYKFS